MFFENAARYPQTKPRSPLSLGREKRLKDSDKMASGDAVAGVSDEHYGFVTQAANPHHDPTAGTLHSLQCVPHDVGEDLSQCRVVVQEVQAGRVAQLEFDPLLRCP